VGSYVVCLSSYEEGYGFPVCRVAAIDENGLYVVDTLKSNKMSTSVDIVRYVQLFDTLL